MRRLRMTIGDHVVHAELYDTPTAEAIYSAAPFSARLKTWGEELEFAAPFERWREPGARRSARRQELIYSVDRRLIAIEMGPDGSDADADLPLAQPCNIFGRAVEDLAPLRDVLSGQTIRLERAED